MTITCALPECRLDIPANRKKYCCEPHARRNRQRSRPLVETLPDMEQVEKDQLRAALYRQQLATERAKSKTEDLVEAVYTAAKDAALAHQYTPRSLPVLDTDGKSKPEVALLHTTDWQLGKKSETYNSEVCASRITLLAAKLALLTSIQRMEHPVNALHIMLGGDMVEGLNIFPGQAYEVDSTLYEQMFTCVNILSFLIEEALGQFKTVDVWEEWGNHGRLGRRGEWPRSDNTDRMVYEVTRRRFANEPRIRWHQHNSWYNLVEIGNYRAMLIHGDEIKSFGGNTPAYGLLRKGTSWASGVTERFKDIYFGHYHTPMTLTLPNGGSMYGTGSTESDNAYAAEFVAAKGQPSQRLNFIDPRKGRVTCEYKVYLGDEELQQ